MSDKTEAEDENPNDTSNEQARTANEIYDNPNEENHLTQTQESEIMEVHHHSSHSHGKKTWRTYSWEFGMLFLAVFCGFLAEYFLEHRIEKEKGKQYVISMIEDLESDAAKINKNLNELKKQEAGLDSLSLLSSKKIYNDSTTTRMYQLMFNHSMNHISLRFTKRTITQLRNSGGMRLITNKASADAITEYNELTEDIENQEKYYEKEGIVELIKLDEKIFNINYLRGFNPKNKNYLPSGVKLVNYDEKLMAEYSNLTFITSRVIKSYCQMLNELEEQIPKTIAILKKENNLK